MTKTELVAILAAILLTGEQIKELPVSLRQKVAVMRALALLEEAEAQVKGAKI